MSTTGKKLTKFLTSLAGAFLVTLPTSSAFSQLTQADISNLKDRAENEHWTFEVGENPATQYSLDQLCGLEEPPDWREQGRFDPMVGLAEGYLPSRFDWRDDGGLPSIKNQGSCGSCWAFATVGALECAIKIVDNVEVNLSEQWLLSCNHNGWDCDGGWFAHSYHQFATDNCDSTGAVLEGDFPYYAYEAPCACPFEHPYKIESWSYIGNSSTVPTVDAIKRAIMEYGPVSVGVVANSAFQSYRKGVFNSNASGDINHAVVLVGWDDTQGTDGVWFLRNSWGPYWGESGYMRIEYGCSKVGYGACYVKYRPFEVSCNNDFGPTPLTVDFAVDATWTNMNSWLWDFGDGSTSADPSPTHQYDEPGLRTVSVTVDTDDGQFTKTVPGMVSAYADSVGVSALSGSMGSPARLDILVTNFLPLGSMTIPVEWDAPYTINYDSLSTVGLRTDYFEKKALLTLDPAHHRLRVLLQASLTNTEPYLDPGSDVVVSLFFTIYGSSWIGDDPFTIGPTDPLFATYAGDYIPDIMVDTLTSGEPCCVGTRGNVDGDPEEIVDLGDLTKLVDYLYISKVPPPCLPEANIDGDPNGVVDIGDLTDLLNYLYVSHSPLPECGP
jgi:C1A family cysteine protease